MSLLVREEIKTENNFETKRVL